MNPMADENNNICMRIHVDQGHRLLAACDKDILGKEFKENEVHLKVSEMFYKDEEVDQDTFLRFLRTVDMANLVGEIVVSAAIEAGFIDSEFVIRIEGIPHAQLCSM